MAKKLSYTALAEKTGISYSSINSQRTRHTLPKTEAIYAIAQCLGTTMEYLLSGKHPTGYLPPRISAIADACITAPEIDLMMIERVLAYSRRGSSSE